jgi:elongation factor P
MIDYSQLKKGVKIVLDGEPYEVLESSPLKKAQRRVVIQTKIKSLLDGKVLEKNFHQGDVFEEADLEKIELKFLYSYRDKFFFCLKDNPSQRFFLTSEQIGEKSRFLKTNQIVEGLKFEGKIINILLPIKISLKVIEAPPGVKGNRAEGGSKQITVETGAKINAPLFIKEGDIIEINTEDGSYIRRVE